VILVLDNYDSFTFNLVHYLQELGGEVEVVRNDAVRAERLLARGYSHVVISPGPCTPDQAGESLALIRASGGRVPILGVCLGHQAIGQAFGGRVGHAREVMHGKPSAIHHDADGLFTGLPTPFTATRYHSLVIEPPSLPDVLLATAWTLDDGGGRDELMAVRHREWPVVGVQFHPEAILTEHGHALLANFLAGNY